jgi:hypothetical protein
MPVASLAAPSGVMGAIGVAVATSIQSVPMLASGRCVDRGHPAHRSKGRLVCKPRRVVARRDEERAGDIDADASKSALVGRGVLREPL